MVGGYLNTEFCLGKNASCARDYVLEMERGAEGELIVVLNFSAVLKTKPFDLRMKQLAK